MANWKTHKLSCKKVAAVASAQANVAPQPSIPTPPSEVALDLPFAPPAIPELDEMAPRDWPHRKGFDPPASWSSLWQLPSAFGTQAARETPPCQCGLSSCPSRKTCGICIHDPVICWQCQGFFNATCVSGFKEKFLQNRMGLSTGLLLNWGQCPLCRATLGGVGLPTTFLVSFGGHFDVSMQDLGTTAPVVKSLTFELSSTSLR